MFTITVPLLTASGAQQGPSDRVSGCYFVDNKAGQAEVYLPLNRLSIEVKSAWSATVVPFILLYCVVLHHRGSLTCADCLSCESVMVSANGYV